MYSKTNQMFFVQSKRLLVVSFFMMIASLLYAGGGEDTWSGTATMGVELVTNTGGGVVYVADSKNATSGEKSLTLNIGNTDPTADFFLFATPSSEDYSFAGWFTDAAGTTSATLVGTNTPNGQGDQHTLTGGKNNSPSVIYYAKFKSVLDYTIVFKAAVGGTYTATHATDVAHSHSITSADFTVDDITNKGSLTFTFQATAASGYEFLRWVIEDVENNTYVYSYENSNTGFQHTFTSSSNVYAEFIPQGTALFCLLGNESAKYHKLSEAVKVAVNSSSNRVIVLERSGTLYLETETVDYFDAPTNKYTIPSNVTLLIPNSNNSAEYKVQMNTLTSEQIHTVPSGQPQPFVEVKQLTIDNGQDIEVEGNVCVYATVVANTGAVCYYGRLHLGDGSNITLNSGAKLNALGYITGHDNSSVIAKNGSIVQEVMQIADWRGGNALAQIAKSASSHKVFPISQYYIQNIEPKLVLESGAIEYLTAFMTMSVLEIPVQGTLIAPEGGNYTGMFRMGSGSIITKYYDKSTDRLKFEVQATVESNVSLDKVTLDLAKGNTLLQIGISGYLGTTSISSKDYVLPINNNIDIYAHDKVTLDVSEDVAILAGSTIRIDKGAKLKTSNNASIYVYDADQHHVQWKDPSIEQSVDQVTNTSIYQYNYYNYFGAASTPISKVANRPGGLQYDRATNDLVVWTNPDDPSNVTQLQKSDAVVVINGAFEGTMYTTDGGASIISNDATASATVKFTNLTTPSIKQIIQKPYNTSVGGDQSQKVVYPNIPCKSSAALQNADGSYSAGGTADTENGKTYTYYPMWNNGEDKPKGRWSDVLPDGQITATEINGTDLTVTLPIEISREVTFVPETRGVNIKGIKEANYAGSGFAATDNPTYKDGVVTIPMKYTPTAEHNYIANATVTIVFDCYNTNLSQDEEVEVIIDLTATQNYTPKFLVNGKEDETTTLTFATTTIGQTSAEQTITIAPIPENVADRKYDYVTWTPDILSATSPFEVISGNYFDGAKIVYKPTTTAGAHSQTLTVTATYSEGVTLERKIVLKGTPALANNTLQFVDDQEIAPLDIINPLFNNVGNNIDNITFTYNGESFSDIVEIVKNAAGDNYVLQVKNGENLYTQHVITIKAHQPANDITLGGSDEIIVTITPPVQWNWSKLYFGNTYTNPIIAQSAEPWTLTYIGYCGAIPAANFTGDYTNGYSVQVASGEECVASFTFTQGDNTYTFYSNVYADPRILDVCLRDENAARTYKDITIESTNVKFIDNNIVFATSETSGATWTMELIGVPDKMEFIPHGEGKRWTILEYDGEVWTTTYNEAEISLPEGQTYFTHNLKASTQQIRVVCSLGAVQGTITDLCVYKLDASASADVNKVYMPIVKDDNAAIVQSQKMIVLSYVSPESDLWLSVEDEVGNTIADITLSSDNLLSGKLPQTTIQNIYREETITISSIYATEGTAYLVVVDNIGNEMLKLPIRLYAYPQPLPIRSAEWKDANAEKYYFYTNMERSQNVQFNDVTQKFTFASSGNNQQYITFAFRGGPSYIEFETQLEMTAYEWYNYWTLQVSDGQTNRLVAENEDAEVQPEISTIVRDGVEYYKVHIDIPYTTNSLTLHTQRVGSIENLVIDGEPDLDVVLGNHTIEHEAEVNFTPDMMTQDVIVTAINLEQVKISCNNPHFVVKHATTSISSTATTLTSSDCPNALGSYKVGNITLNVTWDGVNMVEEGLIIFADQNGQVLSTIRLLGAKDFILKGNSQNTGLFTGFAENIDNHPFKNENAKYQYERRQVNLFNAFDENGVALFDYLVVYGETAAEDLGNTITSPTQSLGSNANTPIYIYRKMQNDQGVYDRYQFVFDQANVNKGQKVALHTAAADGNALIPHAKETEGTEYIDIAEGEQLRVYMTGFCPYASTGFKKNHEGVWLFRGKKNAQLDVYLEDCHIYSRNKTEDGHSYTGKEDPMADIFQDDYARGSGGVLVFECNQDGEYLDSEAFQVTIHTRGSNLLKSNYGCFYEILGVRAYQVSSPVQIRLTSNINFKENSKTHLTFDDKWPTDATNYELFDRTNGFISLQKQANNAPSIDMGNGNTVVNFRGGQVELQNAQNVSDKYKTTLAISYRSGIMSTGEVQIQMAYGIGTDAATEGTVNFYDGTISVIPMYVDPEDRKYYLMDVDEDGNELTTTSCLRCPQNTFVYGGSIYMLRTCMSPTSQGGAPTDGVRPLGRFIYTEQHGYEYNTVDKQQPTNYDDAAQWLVNPVKFPTDITLFEGLADYHQNEGKYTYGIESVTPNEDGQLVLWIPDGFGGVEAEQDRYLTPWKACMPEITAVLAEVGITKIGGTVGGPTAVENLEEVDNLLYCQLDEHIYDVISETTGEGDDERYVYEAPLKVPDGFQMDGVDLGFGDYLRLAPSNIGAADEYEMENEENYNINSKVYYISSATADVWQTFTAPFDVENIWVVETYDENVLAQTTVTDQDEDGTTQRTKVLKIQATHNADFASFFGVAMALGSDKDFDGIFAEYLDWAAFVEDKHQGAIEDYTKRGKFTLTPYDGTNWADANFYLYHNAGNWTIHNADDGEFTPQWEFVQKEGDALLKKGETYSLLFPYCVGCDDDLRSREYWDYWSGKLIIFESTQASKDNPHEIRGSNFVAPTKPAEGEWIFQSEDIVENSSEVVVTGNSTFAQMITERTDVFVYSSDVNAETFYPLSEGDEDMILPTTAFLYGNIPASVEGMPARGVKRTGEIIYDDPNNGGNGNTSNVGNIPTINGGSDIFVTEVVNGINIVVATPQYVRVLSSSGAMLYSGMVESAVDVNLPNNGIYVVAGENTSLKIMY